MSKIKSFFRTRTEAEIKSLDTSLIETPKGLVEIIEKLNPLGEAVILDAASVGLEHPAYQKGNNLQYNARRTMRGVIRTGKMKSYPSYISLTQPRSVKDAEKENRIPLQIREEEFMALRKWSEEEIFKVGYLRFPITGQNRAPILTPFWAIMAGAKIDGYVGRVCSKLPKEFNAGSFVKREYGPVVFVEVPSRRKGHKKYLQRWENVATKNDENKKIIAWSTRLFYGHLEGTDFATSLDATPDNKIWSFSHAGNQADGSVQDFVGINPHCVAGHQTLIEYFRRGGNYTPLEMSQFAIPSREDASFWNKLENNVLMRYTKEGREVFRPLRIDQKSMLMARRVCRHASITNPNSISKTMYWDAERDGRISDYPWLPGEK